MMLSVGMDGRSEQHGCLSRNGEWQLLLRCMSRDDRGVPGTCHGLGCVVLMFSRVTTMQFGGVQVGVVSAQAALDALSPCKQVAVRTARRRPGWGQAKAVDGHQGRVHVLYGIGGG